MAGQGGEHRVDVFALVHGAKARKQVEIVLADLDSVVFEAHGCEIPAMTADGAELLGNPHHLLDAGELLERVRGNRSRGAQQVELRQHPGGPLDLVDLGADARKTLGQLDDALDFVRIRVRVGLHDDDQRASPGRAVSPPRKLRTHISPVNGPRSSALAKSLFLSEICADAEDTSGNHE